MTRRKASRQPVSSFGPQLLSVLLKGARERVDIPCPDQRTMRWLQLRLQTLRGAMEREKHPYYDLACKARTSRAWNETAGEDVDCVLTIQPQDNQFVGILKDAGIEATEHDSDLLSDTSPTQPFDLDEEISTVKDPYAKFKGI